MDRPGFNPFRPKSKPQPRLVMTLLVRDEADVIRDNIEYHLASGVDFIVALDNHSMDGTSDILKEFERTGRLHYLYEASDEYLQDVWVTDLARRAYSEHQADWVINTDADEFFLPQSGSLKDVLKTIPPKVGAISIKRHDMVPFERPEASSPPVEMVYRKQASLEWVLGHPIVDKVIHRGAANIRVARGSHSVTRRFMKPSMACPDIVTFHFPIRSLAQFKNKVAHVGQGRLRNKLSGSRYDYWYASLLAGNLEQVYSSYQLNSSQLKEQIELGHILEDHRLADRLLQLGSHQKDQQ